jgi:hypothetical protein
VTALPEEDRTQGLPVLDVGETIEAQAEAQDARLIVTDRRLVVVRGPVVVVDLRFPKLRRVEFDVEHDREPIVIVVPEDPGEKSHSLALDPEQYDEIARVVGVVAVRIEESDARTRGQDSPEDAVG